MTTLTKIFSLLTDSIHSPIQQQSVSVYIIGNTQEGRLSQILFCVLRYRRVQTESNRIPEIVMRNQYLFVIRFRQR